MSDGITDMMREQESKMLEVALTSPALQWQSNKRGNMSYPPKYRGRVPLKVITAKTIRPDLMEYKKLLGIKDDTVCLKDKEYYVWVNSYGAVSAILPNGERLGLRPAEFEVSEWHGENKPERKVTIEITDKGWTITVLLNSKIYTEEWKISSTGATKVNGNLDKIKNQRLIDSLTGFMPYEIMNTLDSNLH